MQNNKQTTFAMRFSKINVLRYSQNDVEDFNPNKGPLVEFQTSFQLRISEDTNEIGILATVKMVIIKTKELFAELRLECFFEIKPLEQVIIKEDIDIKVPKDLLRNLTSIVIGTIRGVLHEKLKGTQLQNEVYPLVSAEDLINLG